MNHKKTLKIMNDTYLKLKIEHFGNEYEAIQGLLIWYERGTMKMLFQGKEIVTIPLKEVKK